MSTRPDWLDAERLQWVILAVMAVLLYGMYLVTRFVRKVITKFLLFVLLAVAGCCSLVQFPFAAPIYFFYAAPLGALELVEGHPEVHRPTVWTVGAELDLIHPLKERQRLLGVEHITGTDAAVARHANQNRVDSLVDRVAGEVQPDPGRNERQDHRLDEELRDDPGASRTERVPDGDLGFPPRVPGEDQGRDVRGRDDQKQRPDNDPS